MRSSRLRRGLAAIISCAMLFSLTACGGKTTSDNTGGTSQNTGSEGASGDTAQGNIRDTLNVCLSSEPSLLNPTEVGQSNATVVMVQMYEGLLTFDANMNVSCQLAESYDVIDETHYRFHLKKGVKFHNGEEMKASDVIYSLTTSANSSKVAHTAGQLDPDEFKIEDDYTVIIATKEPFAPLLNCLCHHANSIKSEKAAKENADFDRAPVGTGPYEFVSWDVGQKITLKRFEDYHGDKAVTENLVFSIVNESTSRTVMLETGEMDVVVTVPSSSLANLEDNPETIVYEKPGMLAVYLSFNVTHKPLDNQLVRQALSYAINKEELCEVVYEGLVKPSKSPVCPIMLGYTDDVTEYPYDVEKAKELLAEAGYPDGFTINSIISDDSQTVKMAEMVQAYWSQIGVTLDIKQMESATTLAAVGNDEHDTYIGSVNNNIGDPDQHLYKSFSSTMGSDAGNHSMVSDPKVDELLNTGRGTSDTAVREKAYIELGQYLTDQAFWVPITFNNACEVTRSNVQGFELWANNAQRFCDVYVTD